ncbi:hypothetical protein IID26_00755 [Patescibacteria group bacterium]|nr:hypothetical protein [Patescibacteria group bacterium]
MIYLIYGTNGEKARKKANHLLDILIKKKPNVTALRVDAWHFEKGEILEKAKSAGLFETKLIILYDTVLENEVAKEEIEDNLKAISESDNIFIFLEGKIDKKTVSKFSKHAEKVEEHVSVKSQKSIKPFKIFDLSNALVARNKKMLWILYQKGKLYNTSAEEMHGILTWGTKTMLLAHMSNTADEAGLNPFVYRKAKQGARKYSTEELKQLSSHLVSLYHDARRGKHALDNALEMFILRL